LPGGVGDNKNNRNIFSTRKKYIVNMSIDNDVLRLLAQCTFTESGFYCHYFVYKM